MSKIRDALKKYNDKCRNSLMECTSILDEYYNWLSSTEGQSSVLNKIEHFGGSNKWQITTNRKISPEAYTELKRLNKALRKSLDTIEGFEGCELVLILLPYGTVEVELQMIY